MILLSGDKHQDELPQLNKILKVYKNLTKKDFVIILGDFGLLWDLQESATEKRYTEFLVGKPWTTLFIDGNHENFDRLEKLPEMLLFGGRVGVINDSIYHLKRGEVYTLQGKKFFTFGGGVSIDKASRVPFHSWWPQELPNYKEYKNGMDNLEKNNWKVDFILTHDAPSYFYKELNIYDFSHDLPKFFDTVMDKATYEKWYFGHFHCNRFFPGTKFQCLWENVVKIV